MSTNLYRAEIDGLRAVAVVSVILYHAKIYALGVDWFNGGFIGVDIFFVISGFLITRIILSELFETGAFSFLNFYDKRARRILPIFFLVSIVIFPIAWKVLIAPDFFDFLRSTVSALFFTSNIYFYFSAVEYGADSALLKPFLHTWSLGVEEQFYIVFPILLIVWFRFCKKHILILLIFSIIVSLLLCQGLVSKDQDFNFYFPLSRFWELILGSLVAYIELRHGRVKNKLANSILPTVGLGLILFSIFIFGKNISHPSIYTIAPVVGVMMILMFSTGRDIVGLLLGSKYFRYIGLISYSLYLWHFPIFALFRYEYNSLDSVSAFLLIALVFILSVISYRYVEKPFRNKNIISSKMIVVTFSALSLLLVLFSYLVIGGVIKNREMTNVEKIVEKSPYRQETARFEMEYDFSIGSDEKTKLLIVGNSHAEDLLKIMSESNSIKSNFDISLFSPEVRKNTMNYQVVCLDDFLKYNNTTCKGRDFTSHLTEQYAWANFVVLATKWGNRDISVLKSVIEKIISDGKKVLVLSNAPEVKTFGPKSLNRFDDFVLKNQRLPNDLELEILENQAYEDNKSKKDVNTDLQAIVEQLPSDKVFYINRAQLNCTDDDKRCALYRDNSKILWDYGHVTSKGAKYLAKQIDELNWLGVIDASKIR